MQGIGLTSELTLAALVAMTSAALGKPPQEQLAILGSMSIGGTIIKVPELANVLQVCFDAGAKRVLLPMASASDIPTVPAELFSKFQISFYQDPRDAVFKALGAV
jgi:ATP-dependent Lon protease